MAVQSSDKCLIMRNPRRIFDQKRVGSSSFDRTSNGHPWSPVLCSQRQKSLCSLSFVIFDAFVPTGAVMSGPDGRYSSISFWPPIPSEYADSTSGYATIIERLKAHACVASVRARDVR